MATATEVKQELQAGEQFTYLDIAKVDFVDNRNVRFDYGDLDELADMIEAQGLRNPIKIQYVDGKPQLTEGHRRYKAGMLIKQRYEGKDVPQHRGMPVTTYPCIIIDDKTDEKDITVDMLVSNQGKPFLPLEEGELFKRLRDEFKLTIAQISDTVGKSASHISQRLALFNSAPELKKKVEDKTLTPAVATRIATATQGNKEEQKKVATAVEKMQKSGKTPTEINDHIKRNLQKGRLTARELDAAEEVMQEFFAATRHPECTLIEELGWDKKNVTELLHSIETTPNYDFIMQVGALKALAALDEIPLAEFMNKLCRRSTGKDGEFKDADDVVVEVE